MADRRERLYWGWVVVLGAFVIMGVNYGIRYCFGIFVKPMIEEYQWSRSVISAGMSILIVGYGIGGIFSGRLIDRIAPRWMITAGATFAALGLWLTTLVREPWQFYLTYGVGVGLGSGFFGVVVCNSSVGKWFVRKRGLAIGLASVGVGVGMMILSPLAGVAAKLYDWRVGFAGMGAIYLFVGIALSPWLMGRTTPEDYGLRPDGEAGATAATSLAAGPANPVAVAPILRNVRFWILVACYSIAFFAEMSALVHQVPYALDREIDRVAAASTLGMVGVASILGRFFFGWLADRLIDAKRASSLGFLMMAAGMGLLLLASSTTVLFVYALCFGFGYGSMSTLMPYLLADRFGRHALGSIYGLMTFFISLSGALGPVLTGYLFDRNGSYTLAWILNLVLLVAVTFLILALKPGGGQRGK